MTETPTQLVEREFGITLKPHQVKALDALDQKKDVILHVPTGGGKSVVFQGASKVLADHGLTVVVYPLRALVEDQKLSAEKFGVKCIRYYGDIPQGDRKALLEQIKNDPDVTMVLTVPEMLLASKVLCEAIKTRGVALLAIDEAHVFDEWATSFRSSYLKMSRIVKELSVQRILLCSATLTAQGAVKAARVFDRTEWEVIRVPAIRKNLIFKSMNRNVERWLAEAVKSGATPSPAPAIAFFTWKSTINEVAESVKRAAARIPICYHGSMKDSDRKHAQKTWTDGTHWVFATKAFGMGIDKANVRTIFHVQLPTSILDYAQEVGRAGRDGKDSYCYLPSYEVTSNSRRGDLGDSARFLVEKNYPTVAQVQDVWEYLYHHYGDAEGFTKVDPKRIAQDLWREPDDADAVRKSITWLSIADMLNKKERQTGWMFNPEYRPAVPPKKGDARIIDAVSKAVQKHGKSFNSVYFLSDSEMEDFVAPAVGLKGWKEKLKRLAQADLIQCKWPGPMTTQIEITGYDFDDFAEAGKMLNEARDSSIVNLERMIQLALAPPEDRAKLIEAAISLDMTEFEEGMALFCKEKAALEASAAS